MTMDGIGVQGKGVLRSLDGRLYLDDLPLERAVEHLLGKYVEYDVKAPSTFDYEIDAGIRPLVEALRGRGLETISSCEGHMDREYQFPFVTVYVSSGYSLNSLHRKGWYFQLMGRRVFRWRPLSAATNAEELAELQRQALVIALELAGVMQ